MEEPTIRVLVVDDYEPWRRFVSSTLQQKPRIRIIGEASDGAEAVRKAQELQPDLIFLDIGLPEVNGIQAARRILELVPQAKIIFLSAISSQGIAEETMQIGASGYVVKSSARSELLPALESVLQGGRFVSTGLGQSKSAELKDKENATSARNLEFVSPMAKMGGQHEVGFYSDEALFLGDLTQFVAAALESDRAAIVVATAEHREGLLRGLQARGLDVRAAIELGRYIAVDADEALSTFMVDGMPDRERFLTCFGDLVVKAVETAKASEGEHARVGVFGECVQLLWAQGKADAAIQVEKLGNELLRAYDIDILCAYFPRYVTGSMDSQTFQGICAEHSAVRTQELGCEKS